MLNDRQRAMCATSRWSFNDLSAIFLNCTLKRSPEVSHTEGLIRLSREIMEENGVSVKVVRPVDHAIDTTAARPALPTPTRGPADRRTISRIETPRS